MKKVYKYPSSDFYFEVPGDWKQVNHKDWMIYEMVNHDNGGTESRYHEWYYCQFVTGISVDS